MPKSTGLKSLLRLAENEEYDDEDREEDDNDSADDEMDDSVDKGKAVKGPRTKLSASEDRLAKTEEGIETLAQAVGILIKSNRHLINTNSKILKHMETMAEAPEEEMPEGDGDWDDMPQEPTHKEMSLAVQKGKKPASQVAKSSSGRTLAKDDAASSFGEKDSDTPGNRPFDPTDTEESDTIIQDGPSAGPGPVSKSLDDKISAIVGRELAKAFKENSTVMKAVAPGVAGSSSSEAAMGSELSLSMPEYTELFGKARGASFHELNRLRAELGEIPVGWNW